MISMNPMISMISKTPQSYFDKFGALKRLLGPFFKNVGDFLKNVGDFPKNVGHFPKNVGVFFQPLPRKDFSHQIETKIKQEMEELQA